MHALALGLGNQEKPTNGTMARMNTVHPATFVAFKRWMAAQADRDAPKRCRDVLQADAVQELLEHYLPQV